MGEPIVGRPAVRGRIAPDIPVTFRIIARCAALDEPGMPVRGVVGNEIEQKLEAARMGGLDQRVEVGQAAEQRIDVDIVGDVVAEIRHRRGKDRRKP